MKLITVDLPTVSPARITENRKAIEAIIDAWIKTVTPISASVKTDNHTPRIEITLSNGTVITYKQINALKDRIMEALK